MKKLNDGLNMKKIWRDACIMLSFLFFGAGCGVTGFYYAQLEMGARVLGWSTPPSLAFSYGAPFAVVSLACIIVSVILTKKIRGE